MLDIKLIKERPDYVKQRLLDKGCDCTEAIDRILSLDADRRTLIAETESAKAEQNKVSKSIPQLKKEGKDTAPIFAQMKELSDKIVVVKTKVGDNGRLFGAITSKDIAAAISEQTGVEVDKRKIVLDKPIKETGVETLEIKLFQEVNAKVVVKIEGGK
jgi:ribosomal protein L9